jgi:membrane protein DedA with SNARE-associated domain
VEKASEPPDEQHESLLTTIEQDIEAVQEIVEEKLEEAAEALPVVAEVYRWLEEHLPKSRRGRMLLAIILGIVVLVPSVGLLVVTLVVPDLSDRLASFGYAGVFLANLASTATVFIPVPGLTAAGQALIITQAKHLNPIAVGLLGGTGMALGEITAYAAGAAGSEAVESGTLKPPERFRPAIEKIVHRVDWLMDHYGFATLLVLSAIPNPLFEIAGLTAGASRMNFWRFMVAVLIGKNIRGLLLAFVSVPYLT